MKHIYIVKIDNLVINWRLPAFCQFRIFRQKRSVISLKLGS
jgi:hypothetical protein